jgi:hypothetical protein
VLGGAAALLLLAVRDGAVMTGLWWRVAINLLAALLGFQEPVIGAEPQTQEEQP